jgi:urease accessory protein
VLIIQQLALRASPAEIARKERDTLVLTSEQRRWLRGRFTTTRGRAIAFAVPTGTTFDPGAIVWIDSNWYLAIEAAPEPVLAILTADSRSAVRIAFEVGNRHFPLAMEGDDLLVPDDTAMVQLLDRIGARWERRLAVFEPIGKSHSHDRAHELAQNHGRDLAYDHVHEHPRGH